MGCSVELNGDRFREADGLFFFLEEDGVMGLWCRLECIDGRCFFVFCFVKRQMCVDEMVDRGGYGNGHSGRCLCMVIPLSS